LVETVALGVLALMVTEPTDSTVVPATMAAFSAALAPVQALAGQVGLHERGVGLIVVFQNTYCIEMFPLLATG
jgi:hypothetical protein